MGAGGREAQAQLSARCWGGSGRVLSFLLMESHYARALL